MFSVTPFANSTLSCSSRSTAIPLECPWIALKYEMCLEELGFKQYWNLFLAPPLFWSCRGNLIIAFVLTQHSWSQLPGLTSTHFLSHRETAMGVSATASFSRGVALATSFSKALWSLSSVVSVVSVTYFSTSLTIRTQEAVVLKQRSDLNFNTVTISIMTNMSAQHKANFRISSSSRIVTKHRTFSAQLYNSAWSFCIKCDVIIVLFRQFSNQRQSKAWIKFHCRCSSVRGSAAGISIVSKGSCASSFRDAMVSLDTSLHRSAPAPQILSWLADMTLHRINSTFCSLPLTWIVFLRPPLRCNSPLSRALDARNIGWEISENSVISSAFLSQTPSSLSELVPYRFFSDPSPKNDQ